MKINKIKLLTIITGFVSIVSGVILTINRTAIPTWFYIVLGAAWIIEGALMIARCAICDTEE